jgi:hypothetical protein
MKIRVFFATLLPAWLLSFPAASQAQVSLAQALDNTNLVWSTGGTSNKVWFGTNEIVTKTLTYDGIDAARSASITHNQETWLQTSVVGPGTLSFWWKVFSEANGDYLEFHIGGVLQQRISGVMDWHHKSFSIPAGSQSLRWRYVKNASVSESPDWGWVDQVIFSTNLPMPLAQAVDACGHVWNSGGNTNVTFWAGQTNVTRDGVDAAESGAIHHNQETWLEVTVTGATNVSFWWRASCENGFDFLEFYRGTNKLASITGETNWHQRSFSIPAGTQTLRWRYAKDDSITEGQDRGWVDQIVISPNVGTPKPFSLTSPVRLPDGRMRLALVSEEDCNYRILYSTNLNGWGVLTNIAGSNVNMQVIDSAASNSPQRFYQGVTP